MTKPETKRALATAIGVTVLLGSPYSGYAVAEDATEGVIEEVLVTATKRQANEFDVPIAMDTFTNSEIENSGIVDLVDLPLLSPSLQVSEATSWLQPFIRGVGSINNGTGNYSSIAVYVDGLYQVSPQSLSLTTMELAESVQVLKGPQGTLYGRNATGGAILITTSTPKVGNEFSGSVQLDVGDYDTRKFLGQTSFSLGEKAAANLTVSIRERDGFVENFGPGDDLGDEDAWSVSGKLAFEPTDGLSFVLGATYSEADSAQMPHEQIGQFADVVSPFPGLNGPQALWAAFVTGFVPPDDLAGVFPTILGMASQIDFLDKPHETADNNFPVNGFTAGLVKGLSGGSTNYLENTQLHLNVTYSFDTFDVVSITGYQDSLYRLSAEALRANPATLPDLTTIGLPAFTNQGNAGFSGGPDNEVISQEVYAVSMEGAFEWLVGASYLKEDTDQRSTFDFLGTSTLSFYNNFQLEAISAYGEVTYPLSETFALTAGLRYTDEEHEFDEYLSAGRFTLDDDKTTYNLKLIYNTGDLMAYGGVTTGFKSAALNTTSPGDGEVDSEDVTAYEVGFRSRLPNGRVQLTGAAFVYDFENIHLTLNSLSTGTGFLIDGVEADIMGIELGVEAQLTDTLDVFANMTWLDTEYTNNAVIRQTGETQIVDGNKLAHAPDFAASFGLNYFQSLGSRGAVSGRLLGYYNGGAWATQTNITGTGGANDDSYFVANASVSYTDASVRWTVTGYVNNLTDEEYLDGVQDFASLALVGHYANPRHYGIRIRYDF